MLNIDEKLDTISIAGQEFKGIGYRGLMTVNSKTYVTEPTRSNDGSIANIDDYATFIVPRCKVNFKYFSIEDYQRLCHILNSANQFQVTFFDKQFGERRTYMMYVEPEEMAKLYNVGSSVIGLLDYEISFIGTLNDLEKFEVSYIVSNLTKKTIPQYSSTNTYSKGDVVYSIVEDSTHYYKYTNDTSSSGKDLTDEEYWKAIGKVIDQKSEIAWGHSIKILESNDISDFYVIPSGKTFSSWNTQKDGSGFTLLPNTNWSVFESLTLYPIFK